MSTLHINIFKDIMHNFWQLPLYHKNTLVLLLTDPTPNTSKEFPRFLDHKGEGVHALPHIMQQMFSKKKYDVQKS